MIRLPRFALSPALLLLALCSPAPAQTRPSIPWDLQSLSQPPKTFPAPDLQADGVTPIFFDALPYQNKPTRAFAYYALPPNLQPGQKVPAMVLVHGGGGTAFADWVRLWTARGYAAIAMDTCGAIPKGTYGHWQRHTFAGPPGWGGFDQIDQPLQDQWPYHAVATVILAHSFLRSLPQVDPDRIGITGISWGGYLTCIAASVDPRFKLAVPVYGCGFLGHNSTWLDQFKTMGPDQSARWLTLWDPSVYLKYASMPFLWVTGTNDFAYPLDSLQKSYRLPSTPRTLAVRIRMPHGHDGPGENPAEIHAFANALLQADKPLPTIKTFSRTNATVELTYDSPTPITQANLCYTTDRGPWQKRLWQSHPATLSPNDHRASATLPPGTTVYYLTLTDSRHLLISTDHEELP